MSLLDNRGRLFGKINIIDLAAVLAVVFVVCAAGFYFNKINSQRDYKKIGDNKNIIYDIELKNMPPEVKDSLKPGTTITDDVKGVILGKIKEVKDKKPNEDIRENSIDGSYIVARSPVYYQAVITVEASAMLTNDTYKIGEFDIRVGRSIAIKGPDYLATGYVTAVRSLN